MTVSLETLVDRSVKRLGNVQPQLKEYTIELLTRCYNEGILVQISSGFRSNEEQAYIYGQGRPSYTWNGQKYGSSGSIVSNAKPGTSVHNYGLAIDYFLVSDDGNQSLWTVNDKWKRVGSIAKSMGFEWGGDWTSFKDYPHLQFTKGLSIAQLKAGNRPTFPSINTVTSAASTNNKEEEEDMRLILNNHEKTRLAEIFANARKKGTFSSDEHEKAVMDGTMTVGRLAYLTAIIANSK